ncbi:MAG: Flp family type IVb pilin [Methyloceanibacter sp.]|uniref:Flp family type IVb pilin n=1 Tax=Methyloceanibacter sp. TaxID=1965321 RepID=UPI003D6D21A3
MKISAKRFLEDESGVSAIEYAVIAAGMAAILIAAGSTLSGGFSGFAESLAGKMTIE